MLFLAANLLAAQVTADIQADPFLPNLERQVVRLKGSYGVSGVAVLIDSRGYFLAHGSGLPKGVINGQLSMETFNLYVQAEDKETGLVLLTAPILPRGLGSAISVAPNPVSTGDKLVVFTSDGPKKSLVSSDLRIGQVRPSLRYVPLSEIKIEEGRAELTGAVAFNQSGQLVGVLTGVNSPSVQATKADSPAKAFDPNNFGGTRFGGDIRPNFGPGELAVGFSYGPVLLERVIQGFLSPDHKVKHPSIGVFFKQGDTAGAALEAVMPNSPAQVAGLKVGDVIYEAGGYKVPNAVTLAVVLFNQKVGSLLSLKVRRGTATLDATVKVATTPGS